MKYPVDTCLPGISYMRYLTDHKLQYVNLILSVAKI